MSFKFKMTEEEIRKEFDTIPATEKQFTALVQRLLQATAEHVAMQQNGKLLNDLRLKITSAKFQLAFKAACVSMLPVSFDKDTESFSFKQSKVLAIAAKQGWADVVKPKDGEPFPTAVCEKLALYLGGVLSATVWTDYKAPAEPRVKKEVTAESLAEQYKKIAKKAKENGILLSEVIGTSTTPASNDDVDFGELTPLMRELASAARVDASVLTAIKTLVAAHAAKAAA